MDELGEGSNRGKENGEEGKEAQPSTREEELVLKLIDAQAEIEELRSELEKMRAAKGLGIRLTSLWGSGGEEGEGGTPGGAADGTPMISSTRATSVCSVPQSEAESLAEPPPVLHREQSDGTWLIGYRTRRVKFVVLMLILLFCRLFLRDERYPECLMIAPLYRSKEHGPICLQHNLRFSHRPPLNRTATSEDSLWFLRGMGDLPLLEGGTHGIMRRTRDAVKTSTNSFINIDVTRVLATGASAVAIAVLGQGLASAGAFTSALGMTVGYATSATELVLQGWTAYNTALSAGGVVTIGVKAATCGVVMGAGDALGQWLFPVEVDDLTVRKKRKGDARTHKSHLEVEVEEERYGEGDWDDDLGSSSNSTGVDEERDESKSLAVLYLDQTDDWVPPAYLHGMAKTRLRLDFKSIGKFALVGVIITPAVHVWMGFLNTVVVGEGLKAGAIRVALDQTLFAPVMTSFVFSLLGLLEGKTPRDIFKLLRGTLKTAVVSGWKLWIPANLINFSFVPPALQLLYANIVGVLWNIYLSILNRK